MMQASQSRDRNDSAIGRWILFSFASGRSFFAEAEVGAVLVIVGDVSFHESLQMALVHHKHMAEQIPAAIADEALRDSVGKKRVMQTVVMVDYKFSLSRTLSIR